MSAARLLRGAAGALSRCSGWAAAPQAAAGSGAPPAVASTLLPAASARCFGGGVPAASASTAAEAARKGGDEAKGARELKAEALGLKYARGQAQEPWTPTKELFKRKSYFKRMAHLVQAGSPPAPPPPCTLQVLAIQG